MLNIIGLLVTLAVAVNCNNPLSTEKCALKNSKCLKEQAQKALPAFMAGIPELGVEVLDVMDLDEIDFNLSGLQFNLKDGKLKGLKTSVIDEVKWSVDKNLLQINYHVNSSVKGHYKAGGRLLILPITGDGIMKFKLRTLTVKFYITMENKKGDDGQMYAIPSKFSFDYDVIDNAHFSLTNLFNGNKQLSETMLNFLNTNWKQIVKEFGKPIMQVAANKLFKNIKTFMSKIPLHELAEV